MGRGTERGTEGEHRLLQTTAHVTMAECGQPDYLSSSGQPWELQVWPPLARGEQLTAAQHKQTGD